ncbi:MAG: hypothetical protein ABIG44_05425 [Planctomycetota bacterium]
MRFGVLMVLALSCLAADTTCLPILQDQITIPAPIEFGVSIQTPTRDSTVHQGAVIDISWTAYNTSGSNALARLYVESRTDLTQTVLVSNLNVGNTTITPITPWDTTDFGPGVYVIYAELGSSAGTTQTTAAGRITIDAAPTLEFTQPTEDAEFTSADGITIGWTAQDPEGTGQALFGLDLDLNHFNGDELFIHEANIPAEESDGTFDWDGTDLSGNSVEPGTYYLFALLDDNLNLEQAVTADARIIIPEPEEEEEEEEDDPITLGIVEPSEDVDFLDADDELSIEYSVNKFEDVLIDLKVDTDDNHANGNERTILSQVLVAGGTETDTWDWEGAFVDGDAEDAPDGIYRLFIAANTGGAGPEVAEAEGLIYRRATENTPLIALLEPTSVTTGVPGGFIKIRWRDDDPTDEATITLAIDDDPNPAESEDGSEEGDIAEIVILTGREAAGQGDVQDSYLWQVPGTLEPGTYYIFAYIGDDEQSSVAPAPFIISDPANP